MCASMYSFYGYKIEKSIDVSTVSTSYSSFQDKKYFNSTIKMDGKGNFKEGYVYVTDSPNLETTDKKFIMDLDCEVKSLPNPSEIKVTDIK